MDQSLTKNILSSTDHNPLLMDHAMEAWSIHGSVSAYIVFKNIEHQNLIARSEIRFEKITEALGEKIMKAKKN